MDNAHDERCLFCLFAMSPKYVNSNKVCRSNSSFEALDVKFMFVGTADMHLKKHISSFNFHNSFYTSKLTYRNFHIIG